MPSAKVNGTALEYVEQGAGEPVVLVHGSASDYRTWRSQLDAFGARHRTVAYSRRYHWPNAPIPDGADYAMGEHVDDLEALLSALQAVPAHLVGHSYGAFVCLLLAMRRPALVRSMVLAEPPAITLFVSPSPRPAEILRLALKRPRTALAIAKFGATGIAPAVAAARRGDVEAAMRTFGRAVLGWRAYARLSPERLAQVRANAIAAEFLGSGFARLHDGPVRGMRAPTLLLRAQNSPALFHRVTDRLAELLPRAQLAEIPRASHILHEDNPSAFTRAVLPFLAANGTA